MSQMSETPRPVRAWGEYEEWSVHFDSWLDEPYDDVLWQRVWIPRGAQSSWDEVGGTPTSLVQQIEACCLEFGPLRSLRILLSTGEEVQLVRRSGRVTIPQGNRAVMLPSGCMKYSLFASDGSGLHGGWYMPEVTDADAVTRALAEAVAWIQEQVQLVQPEFHVSQSYDGTIHIEVEEVTP